MSASARARRLAGRAARLTDIALSPGAVSAVRHCRPLSAAAFRLVSGLAAAGADPDLVVDVGANRGQFTAATLHRWRRCRVVAFEPIPDLASAVAAIDPQRVTVEQAAVGAEAGTVAVHVHHYAPSSSMLDALDPAEELRVERAPQVRLDDALRDVDLTPEVVLKLDVQGLELAVLDGAAEVLGQVDWLLVEQAFRRAYRDQPLFDDVHRALVDRGFALLRPLDHQVVDGEVVEVDSLYVPRR